MPHIKSTTQEIYFAARGESGAPLVFVHGAGDSHLVWNGQLAALSDVARTFALDLPGHGRSVGAGRATIAEYAIALREFLDSVGIERAVIVGTSMGGAIALTLALETPSRVSGLVLADTGAKLRVAPELLQGLKNDFEATARRLVELFYANGHEGESQGEQVARRTVLKEKSLQQLLATGSTIVYGDFAACDVFDVREQLQLIGVPTLVVCGRDDRMTPLKYSEFLAAQIPHAQLRVIEGAGHMVMLEQPKEFERVVREWLGTLPV